jgi:hypothetical protein
MMLKWQDVPGIATAQELYTLWLQETVKRGVLCNIPLFSMCCWNDSVVEDIMHAACAAFQVVYEVTQEQRPIGDVLEVPVIGTVFQVRT